MSTPYGRLLGLNGKMFSGKSTAAKILLDQDWALVKFAGPLKVIMGHVLRQAGNHSESEIQAATEGVLKNTWLQSIGMTPRKFMQQVGSAYREVLGSPTLWCDIAMNHATLLRQSGRDVAIDDVRFEHPEIGAIRRAGGTLWAIRRPMTSVPIPSEDDARLIVQAPGRPMTDDYRDHMSAIFDGAFREVMADIWPTTYRMTLDEAADIFSGPFLRDYIRPQMSPTPSRVDLLNHASEIELPDTLFDTIIVNNMGLPEYKRTIAYQLRVFNRDCPRPADDPVRRIGQAPVA